MNTVTAIGAPGSITRKFQENPSHGVDCFRALREIVAVIQTDELIPDSVSYMRQALEVISAADKMLAIRE
jgi:hypothetical protein